MKTMKLERCLKVVSIGLSGHSNVECMWEGKGRN